MPKSDREICKRKKRHADEMVARIAAMEAINRYQNAAKLFVYRCTVCLGWHLTRFPLKGVLAVDASTPVCAPAVPKGPRSSYLRLRTVGRGERKVGNITLEDA